MPFWPTRPEKPECPPAGAEAARCRLFTPTHEAPSTAAPTAARHMIPRPARFTLHTLLASQPSRQEPRRGADSPLRPKRLPQPGAGWGPSRGKRRREPPMRPLRGSSPARPYASAWPQVGGGALDYGLEHLAAPGGLEGLVDLLEREDTPAVVEVGGVETAGAQEMEDGPRSIPTRRSPRSGNGTTCPPGAA